ncbi:hypothetical protein [Phenylobacterium koreense]|uniref:Uncharacterized protein n=1 Tax=Phenylobacterium koreense TaxID=266125 RepID=A0ABV2EHH0_9CAUL
MGEKLMVTPEAASLAALMSNFALAAELTLKGVITADEGNAVFATAASMCRANGNELAARIIEVSCPTSVGVDVVERARAHGATISDKLEF